MVYTVQLSMFRAVLPADSLHILTRTPGIVNNFFKFFYPQFYAPVFHRERLISSGFRRVSGACFSKCFVAVQNSEARAVRTLRKVNVRGR